MTGSAHVSVEIPGHAKNHESCDVEVDSHVARAHEMISWIVLSGGKLMSFKLFVVLST